jgi:hypothetical protein
MQCHSSAAGRRESTETSCDCLAHFAAEGMSIGGSFIAVERDIRLERDLSQSTTSPDLINDDRVGRAIEIPS